MALRRELPYRADYAFCGDNHEEDVCNLCRDSFESFSLRLGVEQHIGLRNRTIIWHHFACFFSRFRPTIQEIAHFAQLKYGDQKKIKRAIKRSLLEAFSQLSDLSDEESDDEDGQPSKKKKKSIDTEKNETEDKLKKQSNIFYKNMIFLQSMESKDLTELMEYNGIDVPLKITSQWDRLADAMTFGSLAKCPECSRGQLVFRICGYICVGYSETEGKKRKYFRCQYETRDTPQRNPFRVPQELAQKYDFLKKYKFMRRDRIYIPSLVSAAKELSSDSESSEDSNSQ